MQPTDPQHQALLAQRPADAATGLSARISAILPVFAERQSVADIADGLCRLIGPDLHEIIIVVAGKAPPETIEICNGIADRIEIARVSHQKVNPGLGNAVRQGIDEAGGDHILLMDSDGEMDVGTVPLMVAALKEQRADMVVGSRWVRGGGVEGYGRLKFVLNRGYQLLFRILFRSRVKDLTLGFKLASARIMKALPWDSQFHDIGCETTMRVVKEGCKVVEVPTVWRCRVEGTSSNPFRRNFKYVWKALAILLGPRHLTAEQLKR